MYTSSMTPKTGMIRWVCMTHMFPGVGKQEKPSPADDEEDDSVDVQAFNNPMADEVDDE